MCKSDFPHIRTNKTRRHSSDSISVEGYQLSAPPGFRLVSAGHYLIDGLGGATPQNLQFYGISADHQTASFVYSVSGIDGTTVTEVGVAFWAIWERSNEVPHIFIDEGTDLL